MRGSMLVQWLTTKSVVRSTDDGTCAIDVKIHEESLDESDVSTYGKISSAARDVIDQCIGDRLPNKGGYVEDLGTSHAHGGKLPRLFWPIAISIGRPALHTIRVLCQDVFCRAPY